MTSSPQNALEVPGSSEFVERLFNLAATQADILFVKWFRHWHNGTELKDALHYDETLPDIEPALRAEVLWEQGRFYQGKFFRQNKLRDAEEAARCLLKALQYEPLYFRAMTTLSWIYLSHASITGSHTMLDDAIDLCEYAAVQNPADHEAFPSILQVAAMCLIHRAQLDGCHEDLAIAAQLLHVGLPLLNLAPDDPAMFRLQLAEIHLLRFESLENFEDIDRVASLLDQVPSTYSVHAHHEPSLNLLRGRMYKTKWEFSRSGKDLVESYSAYATMYQATTKNAGSPLWLTTVAELGCADVLRIRGQHYNRDLDLSKSYAFAGFACREARTRVSEGRLSSISRVEAQAQFILGETLRGRYFRYHATRLLDNAISAFRQSVRMTDIRDADFLARAFRLSSVLRIRSTADQTEHYQRQADLFEARYWAGKLVWARIPLRRGQHVDCVLELGHLLWDSGAPVERVIPLYQHAVELDTMHFASRVDSWRSLARALISRGHNTKCIEDLDTARVYLDKVEMLQRERNDRFTSHLPIAASLQSEYYQLTVSDILL